VFECAIPTVECAIPACEGAFRTGFVDRNNCQIYECPNKPPSATHCLVDGVRYAVATSWSDGCNTCTCTESGAAACTMRACERTETAVATRG
jgi:hypothetical protein